MRKSKILHNLLLIIAHIFLLTSVSDSYGEHKMQSMYNLNKALMLKIESKMYSTKKIEIQGLLDFPMDNAIATNMLPGTNAVTRIEFNDKKLEYKTVAKNFKSYVGGGDTVYMPLFNNAWIGYAQNRGFTLLNIKTKECRYYSIAGDTNLLILDIDLIDAEKWLFLFTIEIIPVGGYSKNPQQILRIKDLSTSEGKTISDKIISDKIDVTHHNGILFFTENNTIKAHNLKFEEITHPLVDVIKNEYKSEKDISQLTIHPDLPFAVFSTQDLTTYSEQVFLIKWDINGDKDKPNLICLLDSGSFYKFSYDGQWLVSRSKVSGKRSFVILPVDKDLPYYLGQPIYLGEIPSFPSGQGSYAMTRNPSGLVVSDCTNSDEYFLKKWDFTEAEKLIEKK